MLNHILESLTSAEASVILPRLERVPLQLNAVLSEQGADMTHVYFPIEGMISLVTKLDRYRLESATVGCEGMLGLPVFLRTGVADTECVVQVRGEAWRLSSTAFRELLNGSPGMETSMGRYTAASLAAAYRLAGCNLAHSLAKRCARWLLVVHDNVEGDSFELTHEYLSQMLGVRRAGVTIALANLRGTGIITSSRGKIRVLDRHRLEAEACECDGIIRARYAAFLA